MASIDGKDGTLLILYAMLAFAKLTCLPEQQVGTAACSEPEGQHQQIAIGTNMQVSIMHSERALLTYLAPTSWSCT